MQVGAFRSQFIETWGGRRLDELLLDLMSHELISLHDSNGTTIDGLSGDLTDG
jgi:hypothetical protein